MELHDKLNISFTLLCSPVLEGNLLILSCFCLPTFFKVADLQCWTSVDSYTMTLKSMFH